MYCAINIRVVCLDGAVELHPLYLIRIRVRLRVRFSRGDYFHSISYAVIICDGYSKG